MLQENRRYDIDWLRVIAIGLLLIYHIAIVFQPWGVFIGFIQSSESLESLWIPMSMLNVWRIPLLFFVSGMGVCFAMKKRKWRELLLERAKRILLPFIFGVFCIVPMHMLVWQKFYSQDIAYHANAGHLWFLANIFIYVTLLSPVFFYLKRDQNSKINTLMKKFYSHPLSVLIVVVPFILEVMLVNPEPFELYAMTWHGFFFGLLAFFFGFTFVLNGNSFWPNLLKWKWFYLAGGSILFIVRFTNFELKSPGYLMSLESLIWIFAVFGFGYRYLNQPSKTLTYLSQAAYPVYIVHMVFLYVTSYVILPINAPVLIKLGLIILFTFAGSLGMYDLIIKRLSFLHPLFGLKVKKITLRSNQRSVMAHSPQNRM